MAKLTISLLGTFDVLLDGEPIAHFESVKVRALLAFLAAEADHPHARTALAGLLWPDWPETAAQKNLRHTLYSLRKTLEDHQVNEAIFQSDRLFITFLPGEACQIDALELEKALAGVNRPQTTDSRQLFPISGQPPTISGHPSTVSGQPSAINRLRSTVELYRGPFLEGFILDDSPAFEEWVLGRREHHSQQMLQALGLLADWHEGAGEYAQAEVYARRQLELEPWREPAYQQLMRLLASKGERVQALAQYEQLQKALLAELGVQPSQETVQLYEQIRDGKLKTNIPTGLPDTLSIGSDRPHNNLPLQLSSFIGREKEIEKVQALLAQHRLVTLTGTGGCGKTRLGLQVAGQLLEHYPDGVWLVELAPILQPEQTALSVGRALGLREVPGQSSQEQLLDYLGHRQMLLVLDNCEHLIVACAQVCAAILHACPGVTILATSREALDIEGERAFRVPSLDTPDLSHLPELEAMGQYAAVRLFVERAETALPGFELTKDNGAAVSQVCVRLDGIPLAIELSAARVKLLQVKEISQRLDDRFRLLTGGSRAALPRQQTLRACIDWSYALLTEEERHLLQRLSVFAGGWTLEAAELVSAQGEDVLNLLTQLVERSLVQVERKQGQETRYNLLETIRQYGHEKLVEAGEASQVRQRHLEFFVALTERSEPVQRGPQQEIWLRRLEAEMSNIRLALEWSLAERSDPDWWPEEGMRLVTALSQFWMSRARRREKEEWLERLLELEQRRRGDRPLSVEANPNRVLVVAKALGEINAVESRALYEQLGPVGKRGLAYTSYCLGWEKCMHGDLTQSEALASQGYNLYQELGDKLSMAECLNILCWIADLRSNYDQLNLLVEQNLNLRRQVGDRDGEIGALGWCSWEAFRKQDYEKAEAIKQEQYLFYKGLDHPNGMFLVLSNSGEMAWRRGNPQQAIEIFDQALHILPQRGDITFATDLQLLKACVALSQGNYDQALAWIQDSLATARKRQHSPWVAAALVELGRHSLATHQYDQARQWYHEALSFSREIDHKLNAALAQCGLGKTALAQGNLAAAKSYLAEGFGYFCNEVADIFSVGLNLLCVIAITVQQLMFVQATHLLAAGETLFTGYVNLILPPERQQREDTLAVMRTTLGEEAFATAWTEGQALTVAQMLELALEVVNQKADVRNQASNV